MKDDTIHPLLKSKGNKPRNGRVLSCAICGKEVYANPWNTNKKYCSVTCFNKKQTKAPPRPCVICGTLFKTTPSQIKIGAKYCSPKCATKGRKPKKIGNRRTGLMARTKVMAQRYARLRDCEGSDGYANCISCGVKKHFKELDGGHFIPSTCSYWKFDERNINAQCHKCNRFLHGNARHYYKGMLAKYGEDVLAELEEKEFETKKWTYDELSELYDYYANKISEMGDEI